jgi:hypothetical protein
MEGAPRWNINVSQETDLTLRTFLGSQGVKMSDLSRFVEQAFIDGTLREACAERRAKGSRTSGVLPLGPNETPSRYLSRLARGLFHPSDLPSSPWQKSSFGKKGHIRIFIGRKRSFYKAGRSVKNASVPFFAHRALLPRAARADRRAP